MVVSDPAGELAVDTARLDVGTYELRYENGSQGLEFAVVEQTIAVTAEAVAVTNGTTNSTVEAEPNSSELHLTATRDDDLVDAGTLSSILEVDDPVSERDSDDDGRLDTIVTDGSANETFPADFEGASPGTYEITVTATDTGATGRTNVTVAHPGQGKTPLAPTYRVTGTLRAR